MSYLIYMKFKLLVMSVVVFFVSTIPAFVLARSNNVFGATLNSNGQWSLGATFGSGCLNSICYIGETIIYVINDILVPVLFAVSFMVFLYGVAKTYIWSGGETENVEKGHKIILWGLIGFVIMVSLWGLVNAVSNTFGLTGYGVPYLPTSYGSGGSGFSAGLPIR